MEAGVTKPKSNDDRDGWQRYWAANGMPWRTEPLIDAERQHLLAQRIVPGRDADTMGTRLHPKARQTYREWTKQERIKFNRADVEWLIAARSVRSAAGLDRTRETHDSAHAECDYVLDLNGVDLREVDLTNLSLTCTSAADADFRGAWFDSRNRLDGLQLGNQRRDAYGIATSKRAFSILLIFIVRWLWAGVRIVVMAGALQFLLLGVMDLVPQFSITIFPSSPFPEELDGVSWIVVALFILAFYASDGIGAVNLSDTYPFVGRFAGIGPDSYDARSALLSNVHWNDVDLTVVDWQCLSVLGDEIRAKSIASGRRGLQTRWAHWQSVVSAYEQAERTYRYLIAQLRSQGMTREAERFTLRALRVHRTVMWRRFEFVPALGSLLLDWICGYGYRPFNIAVVYALVLECFQIAYAAVAAHTGHPLTLPEALVVSISAFHGRGFLSATIQPSDPQAVLAAIEAVLGLLLEVTFIATFTQRVFAR